MIELVPLSGKYFETLYQWEQDEEIRRLVGENRKLPFISFSELWYELIARCSECYFIIEHNGTPIGFCNIYNIDKKSKNCEIGYYIAYNRFRGKGIGAMFIRILLKIAFEKHEMNKVYVKTFHDNTGNLKFLEKLGFKQEGYLRQDKFSEGKFKDIVVYGMLKDEFKKFGQ